MNKLTLDIPYDREGIDPECEGRVCDARHNLDRTFNGFTVLRRPEFLLIFLNHSDEYIAPPLRFTTNISLKMRKLSLQINIPGFTQLY